MFWGASEGYGLDMKYSHPFAGNRPSRATWICLLIATATAATSCGGRTSGETTDSGSSNGDAGSAEADAKDRDAPDDAAGPWSQVCPDAPATPGSACDLDRTQCEYGDAWWNVSCDQVFWCNANQWTVFTVSAANCMPEPGPNPAGCPPDQGVIGNTACSDTSLVCYYGQGPNCTCVDPGGDAAAARWSCVPGSLCPSTRPRLGAACSGTAACTYELCTFTEACVDGVWQAENGGC
jgi:hypothetical protein